jgi:two-component system chemotaxis response regulator CheB
MPGGDGLELLQALTGQPSTAVVVISGVTHLAAATTLRALELGAVDFILKYTPGAPVSRASLRREIISKVKIAAASRAGLRLPPAAPAAFVPAVTSLRPSAKPAPLKDTTGVVIVGASTGGPRAVSEVIANLPLDFATPCVIVQHLPATFTQPFAVRCRAAHRCASGSPRPARPRARRDLVAPGSMHLTVRADGRIHLQRQRRKTYHPSINMAMASAASVRRRCRRHRADRIGDDGVTG